MKILRPIRTRASYEAALKEVERLWGARSGTPAGDRLDILATLIETYEDEHYPMDPPDPIDAIKFRMSSKDTCRGGRQVAHAGQMISSATHSRMAGRPAGRPNTTE